MFTVVIIVALVDVQWQSPEREARVCLVFPFLTPNLRAQRQPPTHHVSLASTINCQMLLAVLLAI